MHRIVTLITLALTAAAASAATLEELEAAEEEAARRARIAAGIDLSGGSDGGQQGSGAGNGMDGCIGSGGSGDGGNLTLLGQRSDYKRPDVQKMPPVQRLGPEHPARKALNEMGMKMGLYRDPENVTPEEAARNAAARERKGLHDTYAEYVSYGTNGTMKGGLPMAELFAFVYDGKMEQMAKAYAEYEELLRQYAPLYQAAVAAGSACQ